MIIGFAYNQKPKNAKALDSEYAEFDTVETISELRNAIEANGHKVIDIEADEDAFMKLKNNRDKIQFVFNFAEGLRGESRESQIQMYCELLKIPYLGAGPLSNAIILDKARTKEILSYYCIPTPKFQVFTTGDEKIQKNLNYPVLAKANSEGSSKGINNENLVSNERELRKILKKLIKQYKQKVIVEEFLEGREFTVSLIGNFYDNKTPKILPIVEVNFDHLPKNIHKFDSYEAKWIYDNPEYIKKHKVEPVICPAKLDVKLKEKIHQVALDTFKALDCKDWARVDIRLDKDGTPNVLELNVPVGLLKKPEDNSRMPKAAYTLGWTYETLIGEILNSGLKRYGLKNK